ncbi:MAG: metallophosphoesterase [Gammaproteobacteria bacterium]|nr:metallophosphoesterase [Gammaproteobacteria bacterium]MDH5802757.1 metallophosphoesterase [Gammaproteobacteria bacterium]
MKRISRRQFLGYSVKTGAATMFAGIFAPSASSFFGLGGVAEAASKKVKPFNFAVLTDAHLYDIKGHKFDDILKKAVDDVNKIRPLPDFLLYAGDLGQSGKKEELVKGKKILDKLKMKYKIIPGEHDYYLDMGKAWRGLFGDEHWSFDHNGVHFIGMNSILIPDFWSARKLTPKERMGLLEELECHQCGAWGVGEQQLSWLEQDVKKVSAGTPVVIMTHSPLWEYYPRWNFNTYDAPEIRKILSKFEKVVSIHGHVHQIVYNEIDNIKSCGLLSTSWPWPYPPVELKYPKVKQNRSDPGDFEDGLGTHNIALESNFDANMQWRAFSDLLPDNIKKGLKV